MKNGAQEGQYFVGIMAPKIFLTSLLMKHYLIHRIQMFRNFDFFVKLESSLFIEFVVNF